MRCASVYGKTGPTKWRISIFSNAPGLYSDTVLLNSVVCVNVWDIKFQIAI